LAFDAAVLWLAVRRLLKVEDSCIHVLPIAFFLLRPSSRRLGNLGKMPEYAGHPLVQLFRHGRI